MQFRNRRRAPTDPIEKTNRKSDDEFVREHLQLEDGFEQWSVKWKHPLGEAEYSLSLTRSDLMAEPDLVACLDMVDLTSGQDYRNSAMGWNRKSKLKEMKSPGLRYILVRDDAGVIVAFTSFMPTYEEGQPVVYCYEIHTNHQVRNGGLGKRLMGYLCNVAASLPPVEKVMLTCFVANEGGRAFYTRMGFVTDDISPRPRVLRNGQTRDPDYVILSKVVGRGSAQANSTEATPGPQGPPPT